MRIDLFELVEGLFRGIVYFFYNILESAFWVVRHPVRGPAILYRAYRSGSRRQIGGLTFMFVSYYAAYALMFGIMWDAEGGPLRPDLGNALAGTLEADFWWPVFLSSLASTVLVDSILRLVLRRRFRERRRREAVLATTEFAMFLPAVAVTLATAYLGLLWLFTRAFGAGDVLLWPAAVMVTALAVIAIGPATERFWPRRPRPLRWTQIRAARSVRPAAAARRPFRTQLVRAGQRLVLASVAVAATVPGLALAINAFGELEDAHERIEIVWQDCFQSTDGLRVDAAVRNGTGEPVVVALNDLALFFGDIPDDPSGNWELDRASRFALQAIGEAPAAPVVIAPGDLALVQGRVIEGLPPPPLIGGCLLVGSDAGYTLASRLTSVRS